MDRTSTDSSLVSGLGIGQYVENFESEAEIALKNSKLVTCRSMVVRISVELEPDQPTSSSPDEEQEPVPGPSGCSHGGQSTPNTARFNI